MTCRFLTNMNLSTHSLRKINYLILLVCIFASSCKKPLSNNLLSDLNQGIQGKVLFKEGKFNSNGEIDVEGKIYTVKREILIYELTTIKEVELAENGFVKSIYKNVVATDFSDE